MRTLNDIMEFDHVVRVNEDGSVIGVNDIYAPDLIDDEILGEGWEFYSTGYSGQYNYSGPIMHNSEYLGGRLEEDILSDPGVYVVVVSLYDDEEYAASHDGELYAEGWAVLKLKEED